FGGEIGLGDRRLVVLVRDLAGRIGISAHYGFAASCGGAQRNSEQRIHFHGQAAFCCGASRKARHSRSGVKGMSRWSMPSSASASTTALTKAGGAPTAPASPAPLTPSGLVRHGTTL